MDNNFDVEKHMGKLPINESRIGREIETRIYENRFLSRLEEILNLSGKNKRTSKEERDLSTSVRLVARDVEHLNDTRWNTISSGGNAEILSRLVGSTILDEFPDTVPVEKTKPEFESHYALNNGVFELAVSHISDDIIRDEMRSYFIKTSGTFHYTANQIKKRKLTLDKEINAMKKYFENISK